MAGYLDFINPNRPSIEEENLAVEPAATFGDVASSTFWESILAVSPISKSTGITMQANKSEDMYFGLTGNHLIRDAIEAQGPKYVPNFNIGSGGIAGLKYADIQTSDELKRITDEYITNRRNTEFEKFKDMKTSIELEDDAKREASLAIQTAAEKRAGASGFSSVTGTLAGGFAASIFDPINLATLPLGASAAHGIVKTMLLEAGANVLAEGLSAPAIASWQKEIGEEYGLEDFAMNAASAALFGAGFSGILKGAGKGFEMSKSYAFRLMAEHLDSQKKTDDAIAAQFVSRDFYVREAAPAGVDVDTHFRLVTEAETALKAGRTFDASEIAPDLDAKIKEGYVHETQQRLQKNLNDEAPPKELTKTASTVSDNATDNYKPEIGQEKLIAEMYDSPEFLARQSRDFEESVKNRGLKDDDVVLVDDGLPDGRSKMTIAQLRENLDKGRISQKALSFCAVGE